MKPTPTSQSRSAMAGALSDEACAMNMRPRGTLPAAANHIFPSSALARGCEGRDGGRFPLLALLVDVLPPAERDGEPDEPDDCCDCVGQWVGLLPSNGDGE
jgi:hypothetical protein